ncbi:hypothetical protein BC941DRAFT_438363 [Chlamydoabsidia padenii]|nr:hypothetical protein BC941DRAFT_438363 [Chlamydoabsidia padenii]
MTTALTTTYSTCHQCQDRLHHTLFQTDNNSMLLLRSELGQLREQLNKKNRLLDQQQRDMEQLNSKYVAALDQVAMIQHEKDLAERELEDLTCRLFEQANMMVADEKREVYRLRTELDRTQTQMQVEQTKYKQLLQQQQQRQESTPQLEYPGGGDDMDVGYDQLFSHFIQSFTAKPTLTLHKQHPFMRQCLIGDVEPCLHFGTTNRLPSIKKMVDSMMQQPCVLEQVQSNSTTCLDVLDSPSIGSRWNRFVSGASLVDCAGCGNTLNMQHYYRFRLMEGGGENDWLHLDTHCRDRLLSVCQFFAFIRQLSMNQDLLDYPLYTEMTRLRLDMFYARLGIRRSSFSWSADDDATSTTSTLGPMTPVSSLSRQISNKALDEK